MLTVTIVKMKKRLIYNFNAKQNSVGTFVDKGTSETPKMKIQKTQETLGYINLQ